MFSVNSDQRSVRGLIALEPALTAKIENEVPACAVSLHISLGHPVVLFELPVKEGQMVAKNGVLLRILENQTGQIPVSGGSNGQTFVRVACNQLAYSTPLQFYWLDRAERKESRVELAASSDIWKRSMRITRGVISPAPSLLWRKDRWTEVPQKLESASLVGMKFPLEGGFNRKLETDKLFFSTANQ